MSSLLPEISHVLEGGYLRGTLRQQQNACVPQKHASCLSLPDGLTATTFTVTLVQFRCLSATVSQVILLFLAFVKWAFLSSKVPCSWSYLCISRPQVTYKTMLLLRPPRFPAHSTMFLTTSSPWLCNFSCSFRGMVP